MNSSSRPSKDEFFQRIKNYKPSPEEKAILDRAKAKASTYSTMGAFGLAIPTIFWTRQRNTSLLASFFAISAATFMGSQIGTVFGMFQAAKELKKLPHSELRDILKGTGKKDPYSPEPMPSDIPPVDIPYKAKEADSNRERPDAYQEPMEGEDSAWSAIRKGSQPPSAWDRIRSRGPSRPAPPNANESSANSWGREPVGEPVPSFSDSGSKPQRRNQYGDLMD